MENQDKIFEQFKDASKKVEAKDFPAMDKVWARVEEKLDKKEDKKVIAIWKKIGIAASLLLFFSLGYQFLKSDKELTPENPVVIEENSGKIAPENETIVANPKTEAKTEAVTPEITKRAIIKRETVSSDGDAENAIAFSVTTKDSVNTFAGTEIKSVFNSKADIAETVQVEAKDLTTQNAKIVASEIKTNPITNEKVVTGTVTDSYGPIPGVNVIVKGTNRGTQTDIDGKYTIAANPGEKLEFSFIGMKPSVASVGDSNHMNIALEENNQTLNEVVVTGYQAKRKKNVAASSVTIAQAESDKTSAKLQRAKEASSSKGWTINSNAKRADESNDYNYYRGYFTAKNDDNTSKSSLDAKLQGQVAGLYVNDGSKKYGGNESIVLRGQRTTSVQFDTLANGRLIARNFPGELGNEPLILINGKITNKNILDKIDSNIIQSVKVLKDSEATAIYGYHARKGVILIETKKLSRKERKQLEKLILESELQSTEKIEVSQEDYDSFIENPFESPKKRTAFNFLN